MIAGLLEEHDDARLQEIFKVEKWIDGMTGEEVLDAARRTASGVCSGVLGATVSHRCCSASVAVGRAAGSGWSSARTKARPSVDTLVHTSSVSPGGAAVTAAAASGAPESRRWQTHPTDHMSARSV